MAKLIYCLTKEDIRTHIAGNNINVVTDLMDVNFTQEAARELITDLTAHLQTIEEREKTNQ